MKEFTFTDSHYQPAAEKRQVIRAWEIFLKHGLQEKHFTKALYHHLTQHCEFIAHYSQGGFYSVYFTTGDATCRFLAQFDSRGRCESVEYGSNRWLTQDDYRDIDAAMIEVATPYMLSLIAGAQAAQREVDIRKANALLAKHGVKSNAQV
jgi:hypothetical protein